MNICVVSHSRPAALSQTLLFAEMIGGHYSARQASLCVSLSLVPEGSHPAMLRATLVVLRGPRGTEDRARVFRCVPSMCSCQFICVCVCMFMCVGGEAVLCAPSTHFLTGQLLNLPTSHLRKVSCLMQTLSPQVVLGLQPHSETGLW